jgi:hypothetical protein
VIIQDDQGTILAQTNTGIETNATRGEINKRALHVDTPEIYTWRPPGKASVYDISVPVMSVEEVVPVTFEFDVLDDSEDMLFEPATEPVVTERASGKIGVARIGISLASADAALRQSIITNILVTVILLVLLFFATSWLTGKLISPTRSLLDNINTSSTQILSAAEEQATASVEQSTALTETSTTVEELAATSAEIASNASTVVSIADTTFQSMEAIKTSTNQAAKRILTLGEKSQAIGEIVSVIDDITRQTNLLALNASIEAARAGEAGKGFAVVATEIRKLANNVAGSTNQIKEIIKEIQDATNASILATEEVGKKVETGVELSQETAETAKQISMATQQQRSASEQTVKTIKEMTSVSKQVADSAQQTTAAIKELIKLASLVHNIIGK